MTNDHTMSRPEGGTTGRGSTLAVQAVDRVLQMLQAFDAEQQELGVNDFARLVGVHKSTASRLAATLVRRGFLVQEAKTKRFRLGPEVGRLGLLATGNRNLVTLARDVMDRLAVDTRETVNLAVLEGNDAVNIAQADGPHIVGVGNWTGQRTPLHCASNGKVFLAFCDLPIAPGRLRKITPRTLTNPRELRKELERIRLRGWASNLGELEEGLHAVAVPVFDGAGRCLAALSVSGPSYRMPLERLPQLAEQSQQAAAEIAELLEGNVSRSRASSSGI
ncbi:MAG TPA: IclR family transcriptional regulator [Gemmataceae bacterium]|jgi:DNA-binding IclR family transcriptional regulator